MFLTVKRDWQVPDGSKPKGSGERAVIPAGRHEIERVPNPFGHDAPFLVLKGTLIGGTEGSWRQWEGAENGEFQVIIED